MLRLDGAAGGVWSKSGMTDLADLLCSYVDLGWPILPVFGIYEGRCACPNAAECTQSPGKHPDWHLVQGGVKGATRDKVTIRNWALRSPNGNWAVATGHALTGGGYLAVLDLDPRNGSGETIEAIEAQYGVLPDTPRQISGGGGMHYFFNTENPMDSHSGGPGIDLLGVGKYCLVYPSVTL